MDRTRGDHREARNEVWEAGDAAGGAALPLDPETGGMPFGVSTVSVEVTDMDGRARLCLPDGVGIEAREVNPLLEEVLSPRAWKSIQAFGAQLSALCRDLCSGHLADRGRRRARKVAARR